MSDLTIEPKALSVLREDRGFDRARLAGALSLSARTIRGWERRERRMGADDVSAAARALGLTDREELALSRWAGSVGE